MRRTLTCFAYVLVAVLVLGLGGTACYADEVTMYFTGQTGGTVGNDPGYPYSFNIYENGKLIASNVALMCVNDDRFIQQGSWTADMMTASQADISRAPLGVGSGYYEAATYWISLAVYGHGAVTVADAQAAAWALFNTADRGALSGEAKTLLDDFLAGKDTGILGSYANVDVYIAENGDYGDFLAQDFVAATPEPGTLVLLGTGLFGIAALLYFRKRPQAAPRQLGF